MTRLDWELLAADFAAAYRFDRSTPVVAMSFWHGWDDQRGATLFRTGTKDIDAYNAGRLAWVIYEGMRE